MRVLLWRSVIYLVLPVLVASTALHADDQKWLSCDVQKVRYLYRAQAEAELLDDVNALVDSRGWIHVFWLQSDDHHSIWHTVWDPVAQTTDCDRKPEAVAERGSGLYGVTTDPDGVSITWDRRSADEFMIRCWTSTGTTWGKPRVGPPSTAGLDRWPAFFCHDRSLFWSHYVPSPKLPAPADHVLTEKQLQALTTNPAIIAGVERDELVIEWARSESPTAWSKPIRCLSEQIHGLAEDTDMQVFRNTDKSFSVFVEAFADRPAKRELRQYVLTMGAPSEPRMRARWSLGIGPNQPRVFQIEGEDMYYVVFAADPPEDSMSTHLMWASSAEAGEVHVLAQTDVRCEPPSACFRRFRGVCVGLTAWRLPDGKIEMWGSARNRWHGPVVLPNLKANDVKVILLESAKGFLVVSRDREIVAIPIQLDLPALSNSLDPRS